MLGDVEVDASPAGNLVPSRCLPNPIPGVIAGFGRGDTISRSCEDDFPEETLYMNRSGGRIQMYYESSDHLWDEDTFQAYFQQNNQLLSKFDLIDVTYEKI